MVDTPAATKVQPGMITTRDTDHVDRVLFEIWELSPELWPRWMGAGTTSGLLLGLGLATGWNSTPTMASIWCSRTSFDPTSAFLL